ncbi:MAG: nitrous oxide reductase family maturation protein NosD [Armatimonadetes bacterium]|nr:nitrous oxide reductase family maturation protein NosD [Armatimonadota bacterium]MDW8121704.1 nitrous oxide reductase family maturation protein NosD [Armatimonadota bacterium]
MIYQWGPRGLIVAGAVLLLIASRLPFWQVDVFAPQYPNGLRLITYLDRLEGDVRELDILNHYIGMKPLEGAAQWERKMSRFAVPALLVLVLLSALLPCRWAWIFLIPPLLTPLVFVCDLYYWLYYYGTTLDPKAPFKIQPFLPPLVGEGKVAQFRALASFSTGFYLALLSLALSTAGLYWRLRTCPNKLNLALRRTVPAVTALLLTTLTTDATAADSLNDLINKARPGDTVVVPPGIYYGPVVISKPLRLTGNGAAILDGRGKGSVLIIKAPKTVVEGFLIRNSGSSLPDENAGIDVRASSCIIRRNRLEDVLFGIIVRRAPGTVLSENILIGKKLPSPRRGDLIKVWYSDGVLLEKNDASFGRDVVLWYSKDLTVRGNSVSHSRYGIHFMYCDGAMVEGNLVTQNAVGIYLMYSTNLKVTTSLLVNNRGPSGYGIGLKDISDSLIAQNWIVGNRTGLFAEGALRNQLTENYIAGNDTGFLFFASTYGNTIVHNSFVDNGQQVSLEGKATDEGNRWDGNYWSDYTGYDANSDGIGDLPYRSVRLFESLRESRPSLRMFVFSPAEKALDFAGLLFPVFAPQSRFADSSPRIRPFIPPLSLPHTSPMPIGFFLLSLACVVLGTAGLCLSRSVNAGDESPPSIPTLSEPTEIISVRGLTKRYGTVKALDDVSFMVPAGCLLALWGPNGAGKTTLLKCLLGLLRSDGEVRIAGLDPIRQPKKVRSLIGYLPQEVRLHQELTVSQTLSFYGKLRKVTAERVQQVAHQWRVDQVADKKVGELSGGWRQRLAVAIALLSDPPILLLDEPTANLDHQSRQEFWSFLTELKRSGKAIILSSHRSDEVKNLSDQVIALQQGRIVAQGTPEQLSDILTEKVWLRLYLPNRQRDQAIRQLTAHGFLPSLNGSALRVPVSPEAKAKPITILAAAGLTVENFEVEDGGTSR